MPDTIRRLSFLESVTWRLSLLSAREWLILTAAGLALIGFCVFTTKRNGACYGEELQLQLAFDQSNRDINGLSRIDRAGRCSVYRHRRELLARSSDLMSRCGIGRSARGTYDYLAGHAAEISFYTGLVERKCGDTKL